MQAQEDAAGDVAPGLPRPREPQHHAHPRAVHAGQVRRGRARSRSPRTRRPRSASPTTSTIAIEVDEALPAPAHRVGGRRRRRRRISLWFSGGSFEDPQYQADAASRTARRPSSAPRSCAAATGSTAGFADAPADGELSERQRAIWDVYAEGRLSPARRLRRSTSRRRRYSFRLAIGFNDVADAEYERLWSADVAHLGRARGDRGPAGGRRPAPGDQEADPARVAPPRPEPVSELGCAARRAAIRVAIRGRGRRSPRRGRGRARSASSGVAAVAISTITGSSRWARWASASSHFSMTRNLPGVLADATRSTLRQPATPRVSTTYWARTAASSASRPLRAWNCPATTQISTSSVM